MKVCDICGDPAVRMMSDGQTVHTRCKAHSGDKVRREMHESFLDYHDKKKRDEMWARYYAERGVAAPSPQGVRP